MCFVCLIVLLITYIYIYIYKDDDIHVTYMHTHHMWVCYGPLGVEQIERLAPLSAAVARRDGRAEAQDVALPSLFDASQQGQSLWPLAAEANSHDGGTRHLHVLTEFQGLRPLRGGAS